MNLPNYDISSISTPEEGLEHIGGNLALLREIAEATDFADAAQRASFCSNIAFVKRYYERVDTLLAQRGAA